ncbi:hypothetical protein UA38_21180 [Photobacterium kishitanii]|uniref:DUF2570 domain-containing protein n=1 Tax=Photobacterium kishitanii TaxID=318456 RepID=A0AAX0YV81_9GAMM|nr:hypothetical protein [Photobacterium kishitanii]KJG55180.1 hypothetical protein UA38_21180 [Photobacterium kishitanii]KJG57473.1 hypothetical protein UA42_21360 [Photobacterium kishitanii]KJG63535.1 hypothetical protein UA40_21565 [Photobacterium kishitanii]KJG70692.1 hypothetical protein UA41_05715 [Photobacterium kishitanii]PSX20960.1 hypothetical protein C0W70_01625 [Photobacterium kishitanii]
MAISKFKLIAAAGVLTALSLLAWTYSQTVQKLEAAQALVVEQQIKSTQLVEVNQSMQSTITRLEQASHQERLAAEHNERQRQQWQQRALKAQRQIDKDIAHEKCADLPIPNASQWLYYTKPASGDSIQD